MGLALRILHDTEKYLADAVILGITDKERARPITLKEYLAQRQRMTFGQLIGKLKEAWQLEPDLENFLDLYVQRRNILVHSLTAQAGFDPDTKRGAKRLQKWLRSFLDMTLVAHRLMRGGWTFSAEFLRRSAMNDHPGKFEDVEPPEYLLEEAKSFLAMANPRESNKDITAERLRSEKSSLHARRAPKDRP
jgi:hypothetical protein